MSDNTRVLYVERVVHHPCHDSMAANHQQALAELRGLADAAGISDLPASVEVAIIGYRTSPTEDWTESEPAGQNATEINVRWGIRVEDTSTPTVAG